MTSAPPYHHGHLREALVEAAVEAARERGPDGLALRDLARRVGVSHSAAYRHFADRDSLVAEVAMAGLRRMMLGLQARLDEVTDTEPRPRATARLCAIGRAYVGFALAEPGLFRVVFTSFPTIGDPRDSEIPADVDTFGALGAVLDELVAAGALAPEARPGAEITCWSAVHGFALLHLDGPMREVTDADRAVLLEQLLSTLVRSYAATTDA